MQPKLEKGDNHDSPDVDIESMVERSGCASVYYELEECLGEHDRKWSKCQNFVKALKACDEKRKEPS